MGVRSSGGPFTGVLIVLAVVASLLAGGDPAAATTDAKPDALLGGIVRFSDERPAAGVVVDYFVANADGSRGRFLGDVETDDTGRFSRGVAGGCYVLTYIAPAGQAFVFGGRFHQIGACVDAGEKRTDLDAHLSSPKGDGLTGGRVTFTDGTPVEGLVVDYFVAKPDGSRGRFLGDTGTDADGLFAHPVVPGCYVLTYIAPAGQAFVGGGRFHQIGVCVDAGQERTDLDAQLAAPVSVATIGGTVTFTDGSPVEGLVVDYFGGPGGSRTTFLGNETTDGAGRYGRAVEPGCYVLVFKAPAGARFTDGGIFLESRACVDEGERATVDVTMVPIADVCTIQGTAVITPLDGPQCDALVAFFDSTGGPGWVDSTGWTTPTDPCSWEGIRCRLGSVVELFLPRNGLSGSLPADMARLSGLSNLNLTGNEVGGPFPEGFGALPFAFLNLGRNRFSGPIPPDLSAGLVFDLSRNQLSGPIPPELGRMTGVVIFQVGGNQLSGSIPPELGQLTTANIVSLGGNQLTGTIPAELGQLTGVDSLGLSDNLLTGDITAAMDGLRSSGRLQHLGLSDGPGGNDCFTVADDDLAQWIAGLDPDWAECGQP